MKSIIFMVNGKSMEVDPKTINSEKDIQKIMLQVTSSADESVTQTLDNVDNFDKLLQETKDQREVERKQLQDKADYITGLYNDFLVVYNQYRQHRLDNNITANTRYDSLPQEVLLHLNIIEKNLASKWHIIKTQKAHKFLFDTYPTLKPFCKLLETIYKDMKSSLMGK